MRLFDIALRLLASLAGGVCTYAFAVALLLSDSLGDFAARFASTAVGLVADPVTGGGDTGALSLVPYAFIAAMSAFYFCFPLIADLLRRRAGLN